jgi:multisubunit Na+/H+ antiporter MnhC subunit
MIVQLIDYLKQHLRMVKIFAIIGVAVMLVWTMVGVDTSHAHTWMEKHIPVSGHSSPLPPAWYSSSSPAGWAKAEL